MKYVVALLFAGIALVPATAAGISSRNPDELEVFTAGFPRTLLFRSNQLERWADAGLLESHLAGFNGDTRKYVGEETELRPRWQAIMSEFKQQHPRKLSLIHMNAEARIITRPEFHQKYFAGHWIYRPGGVLQADIGPNETVLTVPDETVFARAKFALRQGPRITGSMLPSIILVPLDEKGNRLWGESEYAQINATDPERKTLTVTRGQYSSTARSFRRHRTYIAPMHCEHWGGNIMWTLNMSTACPRDARGETAADISLREYKEWCGPGGLASHVDGIGFDVMYFAAKAPGWDIDNDGVAENGITAGGRNFVLEGTYAFTKRLRAQMGDAFLLTSDGWEPKAQRAVGTFNGIESEGLCAPSDAWRKYGQTLNAHQYWNLHNDVRPQYSYITSKVLHPDDVPRQAQFRRLGLATACVLGISYATSGDTDRIDGRPMMPEMHRGRADETNWLGLPAGPMVVHFPRAADLPGGAGRPFTTESIKALRTRNCTISVAADGELLVTGSSTNPYEPMQVTLPGIRVTEGDLTVVFEALALEPLTGYEKSDRIPRVVSVHAEGLPEYTDQRGPRSFYNDMMGFMGTPGYTPVYGFFRRAGKGRGTIDITVTFEHQGACKVRNLAAHNAPMTVAREFEHGVVLVNPAEEPVTFDLRHVLPQLRASALWRIRANPAAYRDGAETQQMLSHNDGRREDVSKIKVAALNALFLAKAPQ